MACAPRHRDDTRDPWLPILLALLGLHLAAVIPHLLVPDLVLDYPFHGGDSQDWISNGLAWAGFDVRWSGRPPLVPWLLAGLVHLSALQWFPLINQLAAAGSLLLLFVVLRPAHGGRVAFAATAVLLVNHSFQSLALEVMADVLASGLLFAALALLAAAGRRSSPSSPSVGSSPSGLSSVPGGTLW